MKILLAVAVAVLFFASLAQADSLSDSNGTIFYPDGSVITSEQYVPSTSANDFGGYTYITFAFPGGTGNATNFLQIDAEEYGSLSFSQPVTDLTMDYVGDLYIAFYDNNFVFEGSLLTNQPSGVVTFAGPVSNLMWNTGGEGGISAFSYTEDTPEPSSLLLLATGLVALIGLARK